MKVISLKGNKLTIDLTEDEHDILLRDGLQRWINKEFGENKLKVFPYDETTASNKNNKSFEISDEFSEELISISFVEALKEQIKREEKQKK